MDISDHGFGAKMEQTQNRNKTNQISTLKVVNNHSTKNTKNKNGKKETLTIGPPPPSNEPG
jgi:hypothetical protein